MKHIYLVILLIIPLLFISVDAFSQAIQVTGQVTSTIDGAPVIFVAVEVVGAEANSSTLTGTDGHYDIVAPPNGTLHFYGLGYHDVYEPIQGRNIINVQMTEDVIVIGSEGDSPNDALHPKV